MKRNQKPFGQILEEQREGERTKDVFCEAARIEREKNGLSSDQRFWLIIFRWCVVAGIVIAFLLFRSCGGTLV